VFHGQLPIRKSALAYWRICIIKVPFKRESKPTQVWTCVSFEHQLALTCDSFEHAQISLQV
jgi:hypothetical protein